MPSPAGRLSPWTDQKTIPGIGTRPSFGKTIPKIFLMWSLYLRFSPIIAGESERGLSVHNVDSMLTGQCYMTEIKQESFLLKVQDSPT